MYFSRLGLADFLDFTPGTKKFSLSTFNQLYGSGF
jgi:hypothetical protein